jgi:hypothetical protein
VSFTTTWLIMMAIALTRATVKIKKITRDPCVGRAGRSPPPGITVARR